ncbi:MAG: exonuclease domain-containing protein [Culicoidibacterales bacterium]
MQYYCFIDCEFTSGYAPRLQSVELINLGCVVMNVLGEEVAHYESLVRPTKKSNQKLTKRIRELTHLTQEQIDTAPNFDEFSAEFEAVLHQFEAQFGHQIQWWSWGDYDQIALRQTLLVNNYEGRCTKFVEGIQDLQPYVIPQLFAKIGIKKHQLSLINCKRIFDLGETIQHQALSDARDLADVFFGFRHQTPNWQLVKSFAPKVQAQPVVKVEWQVIENKLTPASYGIFKQLWQIAPPQFTPNIQWQQRQFCFEAQEPIRISQVEAQWLFQHKQVVVIFYRKGQKLPLLSHSFVQSKQTKTLFKQLQGLLKGDEQDETDEQIQLD